MPAWLRYFVAAIIVALVAWIVDAYVPLPPINHVVAIILYVVALITFLYGAYVLVTGLDRGPRV